MAKRIGIFAGSFDPVHKGHVAFALQAIKEAKLDEVYFLPEIKPRGKAGITHIGHRVAMLNLALASHQFLHVLELPDKQFSVARTLPRLRKKFENENLFLLLGSDVWIKAANWPSAEQLFKTVGAVVAVRDKRQFNAGMITSKELYIVKTSEQTVSSTEIRSTIAQTKQVEELLENVQEYITANWLYSTTVEPKNSG